jgi:hypothetical protein
MIDQQFVLRERVESKLASAVAGHGVRVPYAAACLAAAMR